MRRELRNIPAGVAVLALCAAFATACTEPGRSSAVADLAPSSPSNGYTAATPRLEARPELLLKPPGTAGKRQDEPATLTRLVNQGTADLRVDVTALSDGVVTVNSSQGAWDSFEFPMYVDDDPSPPRAMVRVRNRGSVDVLSPGNSDFVFGADFNIDAVNARSGADNGNNLVQRGKHDDQARYKLEVDDDRAECAVKGSAGALSVKAPTAIDPGLWYRVRCIRNGDRLRITLTEFGYDGTTRRFVDKTAGPIGEVLIADPRVPLSVAGKLSRSGLPQRGSSDQFNGLVTNVVYLITD